MPATPMKDVGGTLTVRFDDIALDAQFAVLYPEITPGDFVRIEIADTGQAFRPPDGPDL